MASSFLAATARLGAQYSTPAMAAMCLVATTTSASSNPLQCESSSSSSSRTKQPKAQHASSFLHRRRMTQVGRFSLLSETESNPSIPVMVLAMTGKPWTPHDFIQLYLNRNIPEKHERFNAALEGGDFRISRNHTVPVDHVMHYPVVYRSELKDWIIDAITQPLDLSERLWQARTATGGKIGQSGAISKHQAELIKTEQPPASSDVESLLLFRAHHCMADGVSLGAIFADLMDEGIEFQKRLTLKVKEFRLLKKQKASWWKTLKRWVWFWWWGSIRAFAYQFYLFFQSWIHSDPWAVLEANASPQMLPPRTLSWVQVASLTNVKEVAAYFSQQHTTGGKVTVNDIFCSCIVAATAKLMEYHQHCHPDLNLKLESMNLVIPVHMQGGILFPGQSMGNKIGGMVNRVKLVENTNPQDRLQQVHEVLWNRKQTPAAVWSFLAAKAFGSIGSRLGGLTPWLFEKAHAKASVVVTNVRGPDQQVHLDGRRVASSLGFLPLPPGIPIGMVVSSYNDTITLSVIAKSWAVPDADLFLSWVVEEYQALERQARTMKDGGAVQK